MVVHTGIGPLVTYLGEFKGYLLTLLLDRYYRVHSTETGEI